ncbi:hypothetical protein AVEN_136596-1 [Araneus ventricosus]|uniref:Uncharacterized protein n=1 Tax=Araneus ventricosus TaxID=182803 RepID=A0A4Y2S084_ARAVE|nr:hypothetical protein AVEN_136596-1 [Araneus ventricosus]
MLYLHVLFEIKFFHYLYFFILSPFAKNYFSTNEGILHRTGYFLAEEGKTAEKKWLCEQEHDFYQAGEHIYKPYPDRTEAGNQSISLATRSSDVVFSSPKKRTAIITEQESFYFSSPFSHS